MKEADGNSARADLIEKARAAAQNAYTPYSKCRVGAAVLTSRAVYVGARVENASYGLTMCAEMAAISAAVTAGDRSIKAIAIASMDATAGTPFSERVLCGACRQWIVEFAPDASIYIADIDRDFSISEFLPKAFRFEAGDTY
jgi:cytidine deaminase